MAAAAHCARATVPTMAFQCTATSPRAKLVCCKRHMPPEQKGVGRLGRLTQHGELALPQSSVRQPSGGMEERWDRHCSSAFSANQGDIMGQVQDDRPPSNLELGGASPGGLSKKEIERRCKISAANKGKAPWTKGRKLTQEHRQRIKQSTIEALRDPKVKKKMLGHHRLHRQSSKDKISAALRKVWERRMISVRSRQMILRIWSDTIAEAAKEGGHGQDKLDWDSYDKIQSEMLCMFLWNKEKEQVTKKLKRAVTRIVAKKLQAAEKMEPLTRTKKAKPEKLVPQKSDAQPRQVLASTRTKLKERLTKWHGRKKELEIVISSRTRGEGGLRKLTVARRRAVERRAEVDLATEPGVPPGRMKELHSPCKDGLPCSDT
ncbi:uncharacterized protein LOC123452294 [Hordeum vulgare subsp. vulgare]|uniref:Nuclease associated modular domain-containing protein n=1 Tax=Hordeum vulgare subsp. vulgare TaxID=112509 RepID=A0A8I6WNN2_HORVV|nr:uncharacterized protein LOC123452294 [Hordeum vulgare subsp. vulgare]